MSIIQRNRKDDKEINLKALRKQILRWRLYRKITHMEMENKSYLVKMDTICGVRMRLEINCARNTAQTKPGS